jgi:TRAP-type mannitol/chloroaromatic compound transport system substrate-binding protein
MRAGYPPWVYYLFLCEVGIDMANNWFQAAGHDVYFIPRTGGVGPPELFLHSTKRLETLEDLKGLKIRTFGDTGEPFKVFGAATTYMPAGEIYEATMRGVIDAFEMSSAYMNHKMAYHEVAKYIYISPIRAPSEVQALGVKRSKWEKLPDDLKGIFAEVARAETVEYGRDLHSKEAWALEQFREYGNVVEKLPKAIEEPFKEEYDKVMDGIAAEHPDFATFLHAQRAWAVMWNDLWGLPDWAVPPEAWRQYELPASQ